MYRFLAMFVSLMLLSFIGHAEDNTRYIRDWMAVPLHATIEPESKTVHNGLVSGTKVVLLATDEPSGYSRVRTAEGIEGWIASRYLTAEPVAKVQLEKANTELEELRKMKAQLTNLPSDVRVAAQQVVDLRMENARLQSELDEANKTPTEAAQLATENTRLQSESTAQQQQLTKLTNEVQTLRTGNDRAQFRDGALTVIAGALVAVGVRRMWPKKRSEWS